jgi:hypothetical protein
VEISASLSHRIIHAAGRARLAFNWAFADQPCLRGQLGIDQRAHKFNRGLAIQLAHSDCGKRNGRHLALGR